MAFERLLGPCMDIMKRNTEEYEEQLVRVFGSKVLTLKFWSYCQNLVMQSRSEIPTWSKTGRKLKFRNYNMFVPGKDIQLLRGECRKSKRRRQNLKSDSCDLLNNGLSGWVTSERLLAPTFKLLVRVLVRKWTRWKCWIYFNTMMI